MIKKFVSPNLRYKNGKLYYLNKYESIEKDWDYVNENYYYNIDDTVKKFDYCNINLVVNDYNDNVLVICNFNEDMDESNVKNSLKSINNGICELNNDDNYYTFDI